MKTVIYPSAEAVAIATAGRMLTSLTDALAAREVAHVVLTGGTVGIQTLAAAAHSPLRDLVNWMSVHVWWGDERFVATGDADRNEGQAQEALLRHLKLPEENIHRMGSSTDYSDAEAAAVAYARELARFGDPCPSFDVLMLGLGPDAHVASLFPGHVALTDHKSVVLAVHDSPKPPPTRVSLGLDAIARAREVWVVAAGGSKAEAVRGSLSKAEGNPGGMVKGTEQTLWLLDVAATAAL